MQGLTATASYQSHLSVLAYPCRVRSRLLTTQLEALRAAEQRKRLLAERTRSAEPALPQQGESGEERWRIARGDPYVDRAPCSTLQWPAWGKLPPRNTALSYI